MDQILVSYHSLWSSQDYILSRIKYQMEQFYSKLRKAGRQPTQDTVNLENTRLADKYLIFDLLAVGRHSTLYYGIHEPTGKERVFKFYNLRELETASSFKEKELCKRLSNYHYSLARKCSSIHVLSTYDIYEDRNNKIIVNQYCNLGSLAAEIAARKGHGIDQLKGIAILKQNIHRQCGILHKNLKAKNILIQDGIYKLIDFGLPVVESEDEEGDEVRVPEIIMKKGYDQKAEVWNVGLLFHQILFGQPPRAVVHCSKNYLISSEVRSVFEKNSTHGFKYSPEVHKFLQQSLQTHPQDRMTWKQLVEHPIFQLIVPSPPKNMPPSVLRPHDSNRMSMIIDICEEDEPIESIEQLEVVQLDADFYEKKFNLEQETKAIEKQLEQSYEKLGFYLQLKSLERASWEPLRRGIDKREHVLYEQLKHYYLQCLKVDFVYYDIILIINQIPDFHDSREHVEFLYLLFSRCFFEMSQLHAITQNNGFSSRSQSVLVSCIKRQTHTLYTHVKQGWNNICIAMESQESKLINSFFDKISKIFDDSKFKRKDELLTGIEGPDFTKEEQIKFTRQMYTEHVRERLACENDKKRQLLVRFLDKYEQMWKIEALEEHFLSIRDFMIFQCQPQNDLLRRF